jgi:hypothetical protein
MMEPWQIAQETVYVLEQPADAPYVVAVPHIKPASEISRFRE